MLAPPVGVSIRRRTSRGRIDTPADFFRAAEGGRTKVKHLQALGRSCSTVRRRINAPRAKVYAAFLDPAAIAKWKVPDGMTCHVHEFERREGGAIRISLIYEAPTAAGKTTMRTDTYHGRFVKLVPNEQVVEVDEFETKDPA